MNLSLFSAGQEVYRAIIRNYYHTAMGFVVMYDIGDRKSFCDIRGWLVLFHN